MCHLTWDYWVEQVTGWARDLGFEDPGHGVVSHTGSVALRTLAARTRG
jgi:hypothetical protein